MFVVVALAIFVLAIIISKLATKDDGQSAAHAAAEKALLTKDGLELKGDPVGEYELSGTAHGARMDVKNRGSATPPSVTANKDQIVCILRFDVPFVDQIVCPVKDVDSVMGPLPSTPRVRTEVASFDDAYAAYLQKSQDESAYRGTEGTHGVLGGVPSAILERLLELDLRWARVKEGKCELAFAPLEAADVARAVRVAARIAQGKDDPKIEIEAGPKRAPRDDFRSVESASVVGTWFFGFIAAIPLTAVLDTTSVFRDPAGPIFCNGNPIVYTSSSHKYIQCANDSLQSLFLFHLLCYLIFLGLFVSLIVGIAKLRAMTK